ncbi:MAG TPA: pyrophosphatase PpaX [Bacillota bacterium]|nr:pyrophosphatase PpaX [Bacillota bacterium]
MSIHTVLFDLDGTLIDTNELIIASFQHTFERYGQSFSRDEIIAFNGPPLTETFKRIDPERAEEMIATYREHNVLNHDQYVTAFPHVKKTLRRLQAEKIPLGIVTTKLRKMVDRGLKATGLDGFFKTIITLDDVEHTKPDPEPVLKAISALDADPPTTLMIGDNYHDIEAGRRAGVQTAGVAWSLKGEDVLRTYEPTYMLQDMADLLDIVGLNVS